MVIAYRMNPFTYRIARRVVEVEHIGLVNLIAGKRIAPEFVQGEATPGALAEAVIALLQEGVHREEKIQAIKAVRQKLVGDPRGAAARVADLAAELLSGK